MDYAIVFRTCNSGHRIDIYMNTKLIGKISFDDSTMEIDIAIWSNAEVYARVKYTDPYCKNIIWGIVSEAIYDITKPTDRHERHIDYTLYTYDFQRSLKRFEEYIQSHT